MPDVLLFVAYRLNRIKLGRPSGREVAENNTNARSKPEGKNVDGRTENKGHVHDVRQKKRGAKRQRDPKQTSETPA